MTLEIITPTLGKTKKTVKDLIISTLMFDHPLTLAKLTNAIKKKYSVSVTFQGVRRAVNSMLDDGVLIKKEKEYEINREWILEVKDFIDRLSDSYSSPSGNIKDLEELGEDIKIYTMKNLIESDKLWNKIIAKWFEEDTDKSKENIYPQLSGHTWYVFGQMGEETAIVEQMRKYKIKFYILCNGDTFIDRWCKKYYEDLGCHFMTNNDKDKGNNGKYFSVYKDYIIQTEYPDWLIKEIDEIYNRAKSFDTFDAQKLAKILLKESNIKLVVMRNPLIAEQLRCNIMSRFKLNKK